MTKHYKCDACRSTHACEFVITDNPDYNFSPEDDLEPTACPFPYYVDEHTDRKGHWEETTVTPDPEPSIPLEYEAREIDALLEVIKQKDAIIDNCRSSLEEYRQTTWEHLSKIAYLEKTSDPELYKKLKDTEHIAEDLTTKLKYAEERRNSLWNTLMRELVEYPVTMFFMIILGGILGLFWGLCL